MTLADVRRKETDRLQFYTQVCRHQTIDSPGPGKHPFSNHGPQHAATSSRMSGRCRCRVINICPGNRPFINTQQALTIISALNINKRVPLSGAVSFIYDEASRNETRRRRSIGQVRLGIRLYGSRQYDVFVYVQ